MNRSKWKSPFLDKLTLKNIKQKKVEVKRNSEILPFFEGKSIKIHNGKTYSELLIDKHMIGYKFGEFVPTRKRYIYKSKKKKKKKKK